MQDDPLSAFPGLNTGETLAELRALSRTPMAGANVVPFLPRRARSCRPGVASGQRGVIVLLPRCGEPHAPEIVTKDM